jgi:hypothetical protein
MSIIPPPPAPPATVNVTARISLNAGTTFTVNPDESYSGDRLEGNMFIGYSAGNLVNKGVIWSRGAGVFGSVYAGAINNSGLAVADGRRDHVQVAAFSNTTNQGVTNSGSIYALSQGAAAIGIWDWTTDGAPITNSGLIAAQTDGSAYGIMRMNGGGQIHNLPSGRILAEGIGAQAIRMDGGVNSTGPNPNLIAIWNEGLIEAVSINDPVNLSFALGAIHTFSQSLDIINSGVMRADYAIYISAPDQSGAWDRPETVTNLATGLMDGRIYLGGGDDLLINQGTITGLIELGAGNDEYRGAGAAHPVVLDMGAGDDIISGTGAGADVLTGGAGNDTFKDTAGGHNGDVITDFSPGDRILISDANFANFTFSLVGDQLSYTGGSMRVADFHNMQLRATPAAEGGVQFLFPSGPPIVIGVGAVSIDRELGSEPIRLKDEGSNSALTAIGPTAAGWAHVLPNLLESSNPWHFASSDVLAFA